MPRRILFAAMTISDQDQVRAWCRDWGPEVRTVYRDAKGVMWATIFRTIDGHKAVDVATGEAAVMDVEVPPDWEALFPVILTAGAGITTDPREVTG